MKVCNVRKKISDRAGRVISISMRLTDLQFLIKNVKQIISRDVILKCISYFMNIDEKIRQLWLQHFFIFFNTFYKYKSILYKYINYLNIGWLIVLKSL